MKFYSQIDGKKADIRPDQEVILNVHCVNKHYLTSVKLTPFCVFNIEAKCFVCGETAKGTNLTLKLTKK